MLLYFVVTREDNIIEVTVSLFATEYRHSWLWSKATVFIISQASVKAGRIGTLNYAAAEMDDKSFKIKYFC